MAIKEIATLKTDIGTFRTVATANINDNTTGDVTPADVRGSVHNALDSVVDTIDSVIAVSCQKASNLSDLASASTARTNLGLGNVSNTSDANKPVSTATQTALNLKQNVITNSDSITEGSTKLFLTTTERSKLSNIDSVTAPSIRNIKNLRTINKALAQQETTKDVMTRIGIFGQSFVQNTARWVSPWTKNMQASYRNAGPGFVGVTSSDGGNAGIDGSSWADCTVTRTGTWTDTYRTSTFSFTSCHVTSSTAGDKITIVTPASTPLISTLEFLGLGASANASFRFRINTGASFATIGAWSTNSTFSSGVNTFKSSSRGVSNSLTPATTVSGAFQIEIEVVSGTCNFIGVNLIPSTSNYGLIVHKMGIDGQRVDNFSNLDTTQFTAGVTTFNLDLAILMFGGNDAVKPTGVTPAQFQTNIEAFFDKILASETAKKIDLMFVMPPQNFRTVWQEGNPNTTDYNIASMAEYANAALTACNNKNAVFVNLQPFFGEQYSDYSSTSIVNPLYESDGIHPLSTTGGALISRLLFSILKDNMLIV